MRATPTTTLLLLSALLGGCGGEAARPRDPTLRGTARRLEEAGFTVSAPRRRVSPREDQQARIGRAAGLANELVGARIRTELPTETRWLQVDGHAVRLERFETGEKAARVAEDRRRAEANRPDAGMLVVLQRGDRVLTVEGGGAPRSSPVPGSRPRPTTPPDPALVEDLRAFLSEHETP